MKNERLERIKDFICNLIYPLNIKCIFCGEELDERAQKDTCVKCNSRLPYITHPCLRCGREMGNTTDLVCFNCKSSNFLFTSTHSVFQYRDMIVPVIHRFKYQSHRFLYYPLAEYMCERFATLNLEPDIITSVPLHPARECERGYNQSRLLAEVIANKFSIKYLDLCEKVKENVSQTELDFKSRHDNVKDVYKILKDKRNAIEGKSILIVDDIFTTGATTNEMSRVLKNAGAGDINILTFAHSQHEATY